MILQFVKTNILSKKLKNFLTIFAIMVSVMLIICIQNISKQLSTNVIENVSEYDLIVGKAGSSTGLVMNSVFYYGVPEGNIDISYLETLQNNKYVEKAVPLGMGDNYHGYKIIGTSPEFFENEAFTLKEGAFIQNEYDVVLGATVAKKTGLKVGDEFKSQHGIVADSAEASEHHHDQSYHVVGILNPTNTPNDTALFTTIETLWEAHGLHHEDELEGEYEEEHEGEHEEEHNMEQSQMQDEMQGMQEVEEGLEEESHTLTHGTTSTAEETETTSLLTAILVRSRGLAEQNLLYQDLKKDDKIQVIIPTETLRGILSSLNIGEVVITLIAAVSIVLSVIMLFITMLTSSIERRKDISILRALGAKREVVFRIIMVEIAIIALIGVILGFVFAHLTIGILGNYVVTNYGLNIRAWVVQPGEIGIMIITMLLSLFAGVIPAVMVYRTDATRYLK